MQKKSKRKEKSKFQFRSIKNAQFFHLFYYFLIALVFFLVLFPSVQPETLNIEKYSVSNQTIYAPSTKIDEVATNKKKSEAEDNVETQYTFEKEDQQQRTDYVDSIFNTIIEVNKSTTKESNQEDKQINEKLEKLKKRTNTG
ncbi:hypothetical protein LC087_07735 [Bacillus carboniphilus]|uniref:Metal-dependent phosphohydrolase 7TM extracellular domain-containing protein n=1 Tax=Bacillus carboniphilus TaxID=86663 RepID=A0ABY9JX64_9BACI|nr:hypothetical protein [Bacillus carboniphilus]WLR43984.1 hypothetical protein LC087_07735 [Bacillus carboniphilus]